MVMTIQVCDIWSLVISIILGHHNTNHALEAGSRSSSQEISRLLRKPKVHSRVHESSPLDPVLSQMKPVHAISPLYSFLKGLLTAVVCSFRDPCSGPGCGTTRLALPVLAVRGCLSVAC
jgi:hypothetical protein